ncbi:uncharacterized protein K460DRAFT_382075 [Cucurbitaria berberidis CBS 394.84]|uniref:Zn(2)-C6 fungal-type domain-containing protein n=1 Tax=Cucurbitaria berberidis CBS 394.84 TaxID=1168544 RepID=A0A9P4LDP9_9PLEO|nr:uncharacterized protein K460DRAFT_382075 [Cucurbitaria berberidis CBS 394.84]KAF1850324.1 hypothetical protein K460DRAFT_382075 [Cucurbitaria berberidis CBS 394.84]
MDPTERWQSIAPASVEPGQQRLAPDSKRRRQAIPVACIQCRSGKAKCDGTRPRCIRCKDNELPCQYDVPEGVSRAERMKLLKRDSVSGRLNELERIVASLRSGSDSQASTILARLRLGERVEDVAISLPATPTVLSKPASLLGQDSSGTSGSMVSQESMSSLNESTGTPECRPNSHSFLTSFRGQRPNCPAPASFASSSYASSTKGKQPATPMGVDGNPFLYILFDRDDYLLARSEDEDEDDEDLDETVDPRILLQPSTFETATLPTGSPIEGSRSGRRSSQKQKLIPSMYATHLVSRQHIVQTVRVHPNLDLCNLFGNMPLSSSIRTNHYPSSIQNTQVNNLFLPTWSMMPVNTRPDPGSLKHTFSGILQEATGMMERGAPVELIIETHPNIAALLNEDEYNRSGILSKWAAGMVHSAQLKGDTFTCFASMYLFWYLMRWMIFPSPETYERVPDWLRPTPNQLFMPHINLIDFVAWPAFRELAVQMPAMQERMEWLMDMSINLQCDWSFLTEEACRTNEETGLMDLCPVAKETVNDLLEWSLGPSFRGYVSNADSYVRIRTEEY